MTHILSPKLLSQPNVDSLLNVLTLLKPFDLCNDLYVCSTNEQINGEFTHVLRIDLSDITTVSYTIINDLCLNLTGLPEWIRTGLREYCIAFVSTEHVNDLNDLYLLFIHDIDLNDVVWNAGGRATALFFVTVTLARRFN
jgi:hypothetical protein